MASSHNATESIAPPAARIGASARRLQLAHHPITGVYCDTYVRDMDSLLGMVPRAGSGDTALLTQMYESPYSGASDSNAADDPNRRLEAYMAAAQGAVVRIMLDSFYDDPGDVRSNVATCVYVNGIALSESLDLRCKRASPTGIHNKMGLFCRDGKGCVHTSSINGSENSSKNNRAFAVQVQSDAVYSYPSGVFWHDWGRTWSTWRICW